MKQLQQRKNKGKQNWIYLIFALPGVIYLMINNLIPMVIGIVLALKNVNFPKFICPVPAMNGAKVRKNGMNRVMMIVSPP